MKTIQTKSLSALCGILLLISPEIIGQNYPAIDYNKQSFETDLDSLLHAIKAIHINPFSLISEQDFILKKDSLMSTTQNINNPLIIYKHISYLMALIGDGHTYPFFPEKYYNSSNPLIFPFSVRINSKNSDIRIINNHSAENIDIIGSKLISINGVPSKNLIDCLLKHTCGESKFFKLSAIEKTFGKLLWAIMEYENNFDILIEKNNTLYHYNLNGIKSSGFETTSVQPQKLFYNFELIPEIKTALIEINQFADMERFKTFLDSVFSAIHEANIKNLIIDLRKNGGGDSRIGDELLLYISETPFTQFEKMTTKYSKERREFYQKFGKFRFPDLCDSGMVSMFNLNIPDGEIIEQFIPPMPIKNEQQRFKGEIYLLTSSSTYSSASSFSWCFKHYKMGSIIGEETGGLSITYGDIIRYHLPKSQLQIAISHKMFTQIGATENNNRGAVPDFYVPADLAKDFAIELITGTN